MCPTTPPACRWSGTSIRVRRSGGRRISWWGIRRLLGTSTCGTLSLAFAIPDHPWVDATDGAAVRIAMTVGEAGDGLGVLETVTSESEHEGEAAKVEFSGRQGRINADLTIGADVAGTLAIKANDGLASRGVQLIGAGFIVSTEQATALGLGQMPRLELHIRQYRNGKDLTDKPRGVMVIDLFGLADKEVRARFPAV